MKIKTTLTTILAGTLSVSSASAITLRGSYQNSQVTSFNLAEQGYSDWARWEKSDTASVEMASGYIINTTLTGLTASETYYPGNHSFTQFIDKGNHASSGAYARSGTGASMTITLDLTARYDYSIVVFSRAVNAKHNRNDVEMLATFGNKTDTTVVPKTLSNVDGSFVYALKVTDLATNGQLTIRMTSVNEGKGTLLTVRLGAVGVTATPIP